jgi:hypothetical protein
MLAFQMQKAREHGADRVRVLHISPKANTALRKVTAPSLRRFGDDTFDVFRSVLTQPDAFVSRSTEDLMGALVGKLGEEDEWSSYLARRYAFISPAAS